MYLIRTCSNILTASLFFILVNHFYCNVHAASIYQDYMEDAYGWTDTFHDEGTDSSSHENAHLSGDGSGVKEASGDDVSDDGTVVSVDAVGIDEIGSGIVGSGESGDEKTNVAAESHGDEQDAHWDDYDKGNAYSASDDEDNTRGGDSVSSDDESDDAKADSPADDNGDGDDDDSDDDASDDDTAGGAGSDDDDDAGSDDDAGGDDDAGSDDDAGDDAGSDDDAGDDAGNDDDAGDDAEDAGSDDAAFGADVDVQRRAGAGPVGADVDVQGRAGAGPGSEGDLESDRDEEAEERGGLPLPPDSDEDTIRSSAQKKQRNPCKEGGCLKLQMLNHFPFYKIHSIHPGQMGIPGPGL